MGYSPLYESPENQSHEQVRREMDGRSLIIVRHGERIDEVDEDLWMEAMRSHRALRMGHRKRCRRSEVADPHLTDQGLRQAEHAAEHLLQLLAKDKPVECVYSSRLIRTVQTAYKIAVRFNVPIVLKSSLSESAAAVMRANGAFDFLSIEELAFFAPGVRLIDGDSVQEADEEDVHDFLEEPLGPSTPRNDRLSNWERCLHRIAGRHERSVVVAHRETIRDLAPVMRRTVPYCGLACFKFVPAETSSLILHWCSDNNGHPIFPPPKEAS